MKRLSLLFAGAVLLSLLALACSPKPQPTVTPAPGSTASATASQPGATVTAQPQPTSTRIPISPISQVSVPEVETTFRIKAPANTPPGDNLYVRVHAVDTESMVRHVRLKPEGNGFYSAAIPIGEGALVRYTYDRWDGEGCCEEALRTREALFTGDYAGYRLLKQDSRISVVEDVVPQWGDLKQEFEQAEVSGTVLDAVTGQRLMDAEVTIGGVHVASRYDGSFTVEGLAPGPHRAVAYTVTGGYLPAQVSLDLSAGGMTGLEIRLQPAEMRRVRFTVELPENTPPDVDVRIAGNMWQLGARPSLPNQPVEPSSISAPTLTRQSTATGEVAVGEFDLPAGAYIEYFYTLGLDSVAESTGPSRQFRSFIVGEDRAERRDRVAYWANDFWPVFTVRVKVPENTTPGVPVFMAMGPSHPMTQVAPFEWVAAVGSMPPGSEARFRIVLGNDMAGEDGTPGLGEGGERSITVPDGPEEVFIKVEKWANMPDPAARDAQGGLAVTFRLSVPPGTPAGAHVTLSGDGPALGGEGVAMERVPGNPWLYQATVRLAAPGALSYRYEVEGTELASPGRTISASFHGQEVNDYVAAWPGAPSTAREGWISGIFTPDFWSEAFLAASASTFDAARDVNGEWVVISSVWSYGQIAPVPTVESRPVRIWTVLTPIEDIRAQAAIAREKGFKIFLGPQQNPEIHPDWREQTELARTTGWWEAWLEEAEAQWMWNAVIAEEIGAEMVMLPGFVFHVFPQTDFFADPGYAQQLDLAVQGLIRKVRGIYSGKILISGGQTGYDFPGMADYIGTTTYDLGVPDQLPADASFEEIHAYYEERFEDRVDAIWQRWGKPVLFYTIHAPAKPQAGDPYGQLFQAAAYEAIFQEIAERPYVAGTFSWAFEMVHTPWHDIDGVRGRAAGAVMAKWYELLSGE